MTENTAGEFFKALHGFVTNHTKPLFSKLADLEKKLNELPVPKDGKDADPLVLETLSKRIDSLTDNVNVVNRGLQELVSKFCDFKITIPKDGVDGRDGLPGRDALHLEILDEIEPARKYQRGTFAKYKGGIIRSFRITDPFNETDLEKSGWTVAVDGVADIAVVQGDDLRTFMFGVQYTSGKVFDSKFTLPVVIHRGIFQPHTAYKQGDSVSRDGSMWIALKDMEDSGELPKPPDWQLSVKRGQDANIKVSDDKKGIPVVRLK